MMTDNSRTHHNPSALFSAYNYCKHWGRRTGLADGARVDSALGYLMSGDAQEKWTEYETDAGHCLCPDHQYRNVYCKHQLSFMIQLKHDKLMTDFLQAA